MDNQKESELTPEPFSKVRSLDNFVQNILSIIRYVRLETIGEMERLNE